MATTLLPSTKFTASKKIISADSIKSVSNVQDALSHISKYGTMHTDSIISKDFKTAKFFLSRVNSAIAMHNVSPQFADGGEFGWS